VLPTQFTLSNAGAAFNEDGTLKEEADRAAVRAVATELVTSTIRLRQLA